MSKKIISATVIGLETYLIDVEVDISQDGKAGIYVVGLPGLTISEGRKRITAAFRAMDIKLPKKNYTINLAPADIKKLGTGLDLAIAIALLRENRLYDFKNDLLDKTVFVAELGLDGTLRSIPETFSIVLDMLKLGMKRIVVANSSKLPGSIEGVEVFAASNIEEVIDHFTQTRFMKPLLVKKFIPCVDHIIDFSDINGQYGAKRAMQIAATGHHHSIMMGSPGSGKTLIAQRLITIMPPMSFEEMMQSTRVHAASGALYKNSFVSSRPVRSPHHTISYAGLVGGGSKIQPGEITLSHNGILFLDEVTEFTKKTLELLRQPLESKTVTISRASDVLTFPADFLLVAAFNPCPCGFAGDGTRRCECPRLMIDNYLKKLSGPFIDRIDIQLVLPNVLYDQGNIKTTNKTSREMFEEMQLGLIRQERRGFRNGDMNLQQMKEYCNVTPEGEDIIKLAFDKLNLSMRGYHKTIKVARTIADLADSNEIEATHIKEALSYRQIDQKIASILS